jgi:16S rRNA (adenine1518-N6/adenine1519-N6)-dimethyltransferase
LRLTFAPRFEELGVDAEGFIAFLRLCFAQKRKTMQNNLRAAGYDAAVVVQAAERAGVSLQARAEALPLEDSARLYLALHSH